LLEEAHALHAEHRDRFHAEALTRAE
jgi:hypothetical protein